MNMKDTITMYASIEARDFSQKQRRKLAKTGAAMPGGGFPIANKGDLKNAERAIGRAKNPSATRAHIRQRAKALHVKLGSKWQAAEDSTDMQALMGIPTPGIKTPDSTAYKAAKAKKKKMKADDMQISDPGGARSDMGEARSLMPA